MAIVLLGIEGKSLDPSDLPPNWETELERVGDAIPSNAGALGSEWITLRPGQSVEIRFAVCWHFPNGQLGSLFSRNILRASEQRNYYSKRYEDAAAVARDLAELVPPIYEMSCRVRTADGVHKSSSPSPPLEKLGF
jgi:hypothetical protein